jgi:hypothetical protein
MRVDLGEVEFSSDKEEDGAHGCEACVSAGFAFGGLEESVGSVPKLGGMLKFGG